MNKVFIEVGSTVTKVDLFDGINIRKLEDITIFFKKNYNESNKLKDEDINLLINKVKELKEKYLDIMVYGTSIFRKLTDGQKEEFLSNFKKATGIDFIIISQEDEGTLSVIGATSKINQKACVLIGGGGSTEIAIYDKGIKEKCNSSFGVMDVLSKFIDLNDDIASSSLEEVMAYIEENIKVPKEQADILVLAGGAHEYFARQSGIRYEKNNLYEDSFCPIMMDIDTRVEDTKKFFTEISLEKIKEREPDPNWWDATRAMCALVLVVAKKISATVIVPTNVAIVHGIIVKEKQNVK